MGFADAVKALYRNYAKFDGRASRSEYWWAFLYFILLYAGLLIGTSVDLGSLGTLLTLALSLLVLGTCIPMITVSVRRLHDCDKSGWFYLLGLIPIVAFISFTFMYSRAPAAQTVSDLILQTATKREDSHMQGSQR